jgi:hypothetical protein
MMNYELRIVNDELALFSGDAFNDRGINWLIPR